MPNDYYVYLLLDPTNFYIPFYVGKGRKDRAVSHLWKKAARDNEYKSRKIQKIRSSGEEPVIQYWTTNLSESDAYDLEEQLIERFGRATLRDGGILTNITPSGKPPSALGRSVAASTRKKIGDAQRGELNHRYGVEWSDEQKELRRQKNLAAGRKPPVRSGPMSEEQKAAIGAGNRGKKRSPEICAKLSEQRTGRARKPPSVETIERIRLSNIATAERKREARIAAGAKPSDRLTER